jgi:hypothetical protein
MVRCGAVCAVRSRQRNVPLGPVLLTKRTVGSAIRSQRFSSHWARSQRFISHPGHVEHPLPAPAPRPAFATRTLRLSDVLRRFGH